MTKNNFERKFRKSWCTVNCFNVAFSIKNQKFFIVQNQYFVFDA